MAFQYFLTIRRVETIKVWATDEERLKWHKDTDIEYAKCKEDPDYVCSPKYISDSNKFGPAEVALQSPYRAGMMGIGYYLYSTVVTC